MAANRRTVQIGQYLSDRARSRNCSYIPRVDCAATDCSRFDANAISADPCEEQRCFVITADNYEEYQDNLPSANVQNLPEPSNALYEKPARAWHARAF